MKAEVEQALRASIRKWELNAQVETLSAATLGQDDCPLCQISKNERGNVDCLLCPVYQRTGQPGCQATPYTAASSAEMHSDLDEFHRAAQAEVEFLRSLLS